MYLKSTWKSKYFCNVLKYKYKYTRFLRNVLLSTFQVLYKLYLSTKYCWPALLADKYVVNVLPAMHFCFLRLLCMPVFHFFLVLLCTESTTINVLLYYTNFLLIIIYSGPHLGSLTVTKSIL